jgi:hypothetical protein
VNTPNASGPASSPPAPPAANGNTPPPPAGDDAPVVLSAEDQAAAAAAEAADAAAAAANGDPAPNRREAAVRIPDVIAERNAAMDYANYWRDQALKVLQPPGGAAPAATQPGAAQNGPAPTRPAPKLTDFPAEGGGYDAVKWSEALTTWNGEQIDARVEHREQVRAQQQQATTVQQQYNAKVAAFRTTVPDFDIVAQNPNLPVSEHMVTAIMSADLGPQVYYHLAKNPHEAARIYRLPPNQQATAIAKLEGKLEATQQARPGGAPPAPTGGKPPGSSTPAPRQQSRAPDPPNPTRAGGAPEVNLANCSLDEYLAQRLPHISRSGAKR